MRTVHGSLNVSTEWCTNSAGATHRMIDSGCNSLLRESLGTDTHMHTHTETDTSTSWSEIQREISGHLAPHMSSVSAGIQAIRSKQQHMKETQLPSSLQPSSATLQIPQREMFASTHRRFSRLSVYEYVVVLASGAKTAKGQWGWQKHYHYFSNHLQWLFIHWTVCAASSTLSTSTVNTQFSCLHKYLNIPKVLIPCQTHWNSYVVTHN